MKSNLKFLLIAFFAVSISSFGICQKLDKKDIKDLEVLIKANREIAENKNKELQNSLNTILAMLSDIKNQDSSAQIIEALKKDTNGLNDEIRSLNKQNILNEQNKNRYEKDYNDVKDKYDKINQKFEDEVTRLSATAYSEMDLVYMKYLSDNVKDNKQTLEKLIKQKEALNAGENCLNQMLNSKNIANAILGLDNAFKADNTNEEYKKMKKLLEGYCTANNNFLSETKALESLNQDIKIKYAKGKIGLFVEYAYLRKLLIDYVSNNALGSLPNLVRCN